MNQDPTTRVSPQVLPHLHLVVDFAYPIAQQTHQQFVLDELQKAPRVADNNAFSWQFLDAPQDGTILLIYQPPQKANVWASDGYTWVPEQQYRQAYGPFIIEMYVATNGYNPAVETRAGPAMHCRQRYRLLSDPNNPTKQGSPALWLVHYKRADRVEPGGRIPISQAEAQSLNARNYLKQLGQLQEKKFMLADVQNWPAITLPDAAAQHNALTFVGGQMASRMHMHMQMQQQQQQQHQQQQQQAYGRDHGPSPKRARHGTNTSQRSAPAQPPAPQPEIDEDEIAESDRRDVFDILTQRDISTMRFKNHEEWMEELFSGYSTFDIKPVDLGFDRAGFMQPITDGFFSKVDRQPTPAQEAWKQTDEHYTNVTAKPFEEGKTKQFARAVETRIASNNAQIAEMKRIHQERIKSLGKGSLLRDAAARIRGEQQQHSRHKAKSSRENSPSEGKPASNQHNEDEIVEEVTKQIESKLGKAISTRHEIKVVQKGGLVETSASKLKTNGDVTDQAASLFDDFLDVGDSAETSNKPSASPLPSNQVPQQEGARDQPNDDWVMVQKQDGDAGAPQQSQPQVQSNSLIPSAGAADVDDGLNDMISFDQTPGGDIDQDHDGGAFDDAMHFDAMDTPVAADTPGFELGGDHTDGDHLESAGPQSGAEHPPSSDANPTGTTVVQPSIAAVEAAPGIPAHLPQAHDVPAVTTSAPVSTATTAGVTAPADAHHPDIEVGNDSAIPPAHDTSDTAMDMMDDSAFGDAFHHTETEEN